MHLKIAFFIFISIFFVNVRVLYAKMDSHRFDMKMFALMKSLNYMKERPAQMNTDTTFGVTFVEANLHYVSFHENIMYLNTHQRDFFKKIWILSHNTQQILHVNENPLDENTTKLSIGLNRPWIWMKPIVWKNMMLERSYVPNPNLTIMEAIVSMFVGHPQANESDACLLDLIDHCHFSDMCRDLIMNNNGTTGYPLTHRLLIAQTITALQCKSNITQFLPSVKFNMCTLILQDLINLEALGFPNVSRDLALEQVFLCGMEGYLDFLNKHYEQLVLDWQHSSGCYRAFEDHPNRSKRAGGFTDFDCINHTTGLAAAVLALMIRKDIEMLKIR